MYHADGPRGYQGKEALGLGSSRAGALDLCHVVGRKSPFSLYDYGLATYDRDTTFDEKASAGFIEIDTLSLKTWAKVQGPSSAAAQA